MAPRSAAPNTCRRRLPVSLPNRRMNPVLLKPGSDHRSHIVLRGEPCGTLESGEYAHGRAHLAAAAFAAYDELAGRFEVIICEGAGSPAEINLRAGDYVESRPSSGEEACPS